MKLTVGSLFSGIGGLDLGLERAGMEVRWQVENNEYCRRVLAKHWPNVELYSDVRECGAGNLERVDLICGGFPCQPVSVAGKQKGVEDERWLWPEFARIIRELRPRFVLAENVPGLLSVDAGRIFGGVLRDLAACGYDAEWDCIPAAAVGAPHRRDRVFIVAHADRIRRNHKRIFTRTNRQGGGKPNRLTDSCCCSTGDVANAESVYVQGLNGGQRQGELGGGRWWAVEPDVGRVADGVPQRVDRLRGLGNAVVPQVAEWIGRRIIEVASKGS